MKDREGERGERGFQQQQQQEQQQLELRYYTHTYCIRFRSLISISKNSVCFSLISLIFRRLRYDGLWETKTAGDLLVATIMIFNDANMHRTLI